MDNNYCFIIETISFNFIKINIGQFCKLYVSTKRFFFSYNCSTMIVFVEIVSWNGEDNRAGNNCIEGVIQSIRKSQFIAFN